MKKMMGKAVWLSFAFVVLVILAAAVSAPAEAQTKDAAFVAWVRSADPYFKRIPAAKLVSLGKLECQVLDDGYDVSDLMDVAQDRGGFTYRQAAIITSAAVAFYCMRYDYKIDEFTS